MLLKEMSMTKMLLYYRYISLVVTSIFYVFEVHQHSMVQMLMVIVSMMSTALVMHYLYMQSKGNKKEVAILVFIEVLGNCILLASSGGLQSPYIWYMLNTIIIAGIELGPKFLWINVVMYLISMIGGCYLVDRPGNVQFELTDLNLMAGFILVAFMIRILISYLKSLEEQRKQVQHYLDYTLKLYKTVYLFTSQEDREKLIQVILEYIRDTRNLSSALFFEFRNQGKPLYPYAYGLEQEEIDQITEQVQASKLSQVCERDHVEVLHYQEDFIGIPIRYSHDTFGVLVVQEKGNIEELKFIAYVSGMIFKKIEIESINHELIVSAEQNRIANEIHDSVVQQLFGVSCHLFTMTKKIKVIDEEQLTTELREIRTTITGAMTELRTTIYGMSWNKQGKNGFLEKLEDYIETMKNLHHIDIQYEIKGDIHILNIEEQRSLYRVCCEGIANGVRHGKATQILVQFEIEQPGLSLIIQDNGVGFDYAYSVAHNQLGLGIRNMQQLIHQLGGEMAIYSKTRQGTIIDIQIGQHKNREKVRIYGEAVV